MEDIINYNIFALRIQINKILDNNIKYGPEEKRDKIIELASKLCELEKRLKKINKQERKRFIYEQMS